MKKGFIIFLLLLIIAVSFMYALPNLAKGSFATAFFAMGTTVKSLIEKYAIAIEGDKIKILIVPGHEPTTGGAEYEDLRERQMNLELSLQLKSLLDNNPKFQTVLFRDEKGFNTNFQSYLNNNKQKIRSWVSAKKSEMLSLASEGKVNFLTPPVYHADAKSGVVLYLYGLNKWASLKNFDIAIHVHFNDNPKYNGQPTYEGFTIYVPEKQYSNSTSSKVLAQNIFDELIKIEPISTLPGESQGITEDQDLIAIGSYNTSDTLSVLIEYGYIYEDKFQSSSTRNQYISDAASSTAKAINDFFDSRAIFIN